VVTLCGAAVAASIGAAIVSEAQKLSRTTVGTARAIRNNRMKESRFASSSTSELMVATSTHDYNVVTILRTKVVRVRPIVWVSARSLVSELISRAVPRGRPPSGALQARKPLKNFFERWAAASVGP